MDNTMVVTLENILAEKLVGLKENYLVDMLAAMMESSVVYM